MFKFVKVVKVDSSLSLLMTMKHGHFLLVYWYKCNYSSLMMVVMMMMLLMLMLMFIMTMRRLTWSACLSLSDCVGMLEHLHGEV